MGQWCYALAHDYCGMVDWNCCGSGSGNLTEKWHDLVVRILDLKVRMLVMSLSLSLSGAVKLHNTMKPIKGR